MFVLMSLMIMCLQRVHVLLPGTHQPSAPALRAAQAAKLVAAPQTSSLALIHAPTPQLTS
jgi:hypothetical protein